MTTSLRVNVGKNEWKMNDELGCGVLSILIFWGGTVYVNSHLCGHGDVDRWCMLFNTPNHTDRWEMKSKYLNPKEPLQYLTSHRQLWIHRSALCTNPSPRSQAHGKKTTNLNACPITFLYLTKGLRAALPTLVGLTNSPVVVLRVVFSTHTNIVMVG